MGNLNRNTNGLIIVNRKPTGKSTFLREVVSENIDILVFDDCRFTDWEIKYNDKFIKNAINIGNVILMAGSEIYDKELTLDLAEKYGLKIFHDTNDAIAFYRLNAIP